MNPFAYNGIENYSELAGLNHTGTDLFNISSNLGAPELRCVFPEPEFDGYSEVSVDTSSVLSFDSSFGNYFNEDGGRFIHPLMRSMRGSSFMEYGCTGREVS